MVPSLALQHSPVMLGNLNCLILDQEHANITYVAYHTRQKRTNYILTALVHLLFCIKLAIILDIMVLSKVIRLIRGIVVYKIFMLISKYLEFQICFLSLIKLILLYIIYMPLLILIPVSSHHCG